MKQEGMFGWHFVNNNKTLRDGSPLPAVGKKLIHKGDLILCKQGLHASVRAIDALMYAPGEQICRVNISGEIIKSPDKVVASERTILWHADATDVLRIFARMCARDVLHLWEAPEVVKQYLTTGDESIRDAARAAAWDVAWDGAWDGARAGARAAVRAAAKAAAVNAAADDARDVAKAAAWAAARITAKAAARDKMLTKFNQRITRMLNTLK